MTTINPYVTFSGNCREAMTFYKECLGGDLAMQVISDYPAMAEQMPEDKRQSIMHSSLTKNGTLLLMASDMAGAAQVVGNNISLNINCMSEEEINTFFSKLSEGGRIVDPLKVQFWGAMFGALYDKFGIRWMFNYDKNAK